MEICFKGIFGCFRENVRVLVYCLVAGQKEVKPNPSFISGQCVLIVTLVFFKGMLFGLSVTCVSGLVLLFSKIEKMEQTYYLYQNI